MRFVRASSLRFLALALAVALGVGLLAAPGSEAAPLPVGSVQVLPVVDGRLEARWDAMAGAVDYTVTARDLLGHSTTAGCTACTRVRVATTGLLATATVAVVGRGSDGSVVGEATSVPKTLPPIGAHLAPVGLQATQRPGDLSLDVTWSPNPLGWAPDTYVVELWRRDATWARTSQALFRLPDDGERANIPVFPGTYSVVVKAGTSEGLSGPATSAVVTVTNPCGGTDTCVHVGGAPATDRVERRGQGFLNGTWGPERSLDLEAMRDLDVRSWRLAGRGPALTARAVGADITTQVLSDLWGTETAPSNGGYMQAPWTDLDQYAAFVEATVEKATAEGWAPTYWDVWNEPDLNCCPAMSPADASAMTVDRVLESFDVAWHAIKRADPAARVLGPSLAVLALSPDPTGQRLDLTSFLTYSEAHGLVWDAVSWHENSLRAPTGDLGGTTTNVDEHIRSAREVLAQHPEAVPSGSMLVNEYGDPTVSLLAGWTVGYFRAFEDAGVDASKACYANECGVASPAGILGPDGSTRRAVYWAHRAYAEMADLPRVGVISTAAWQLDGIAAQDDAAQALRVLLGRHVTCNRPVNPSCTTAAVSSPSRTVVDVAWPYGAGEVRVVAERLPAGVSTVDAPLPLLDTIVPVVDGTVTVDLGTIADGDAVDLQLTAAPNEAPAVTPVAPVAIPWGDRLEVQVPATDADGDALTFSLTDPPAGAQIDDTGTLTWTPTAAQVGTTSLIVEVSDGRATTETAIELTVQRRATSITYVGATTGQHTDDVAVAARVVDAVSGAPLEAGHEIGFSLDGATVTASTDDTGRAAGSLPAGPAGASTVTSSFVGDTAWLPAVTTTAITIQKESATLLLTGTHTTFSPAGSATVLLSASVDEQADGHLGDQLAGSQVTFRSTTGAALCTATVTSAGSGAGTATCAASLATGAHAVITTLAGPNHQAIADVSAVVVGRTASKAFAGAGRTYVGSARDDFAFHAVMATSKVPVSGSGVHVFRSSDGGTAIVVRSTTAKSASSKCTNTMVCTTTLNLTSATTRLVNLTTGGTTSVSGASSLVLTGVTPDRYAVSITGAITRKVGTSTQPVRISAGTIVRLL